MSHPRLFIIDPQLKNYQGHHFEYCQSVAEAAQKQGLEPIVLANKDFEITETGDVAYRRVFRHGQFDRQPNAWRVDMMRGLDAENITADDHVFIHTIYMPEMQQLQAMMLLMPPKIMPHWHILLRRDLEEYAVQEKYFLSNFFRAIANVPSFIARAHFYADTVELCDQYDYYAAEAHKTVTVVPIPQRHELLGAVHPAEKRDVITISYLGDARTEKGYPYLAEAVSYAVQHASRPVKFVMQSGFNIPGGEPGVADAKKKMESFPNVECPTGPFNAEDYYKLLQAADIVVLPYNAKLYSRRSSGPLSESLASGKVTVVPQRTWLSTQIDETRGVTFEAYSQLGVALCKAIDNFDALNASAKKYAPLYRSGNTPDGLIKTLIRQAAKPWRPAMPDKSTRKVLVVCEAWVVDLYTGSGRGSGSSHMRYLREQGFEVHVLVRLDLWAHQFPSVDIQQYLRCKEFCAAFGIRSLSFAWYPSGWSYSKNPADDRIAAVASLEQFRDNDFMSDVLIREQYVIDPSFQKFVSETQFEFVLLHYACNRVLLDKLDLKGAPVICETHDNMSKGKAVMRGDAEPDAQEVALENELLGKCQGIICVSDEETEEFAAALPNKPVVHLVPVIERHLDPEEAIAGCINMIDVAQAADILDIARVQPQVKQLEAQLNIDLLMVSSNHSLTAKSLVKFYKEIFVPHLKPRNIRLTVVGAMLPPREIGPEETHVQFLGRVEDLSPFYAASRLVILPIYYGTGVGIKTLEALSLGQPMLGTTRAFRGVSRDFIKAAQPLICDDTKVFTNRILDLMGDASKRQANAAVVRQLAATTPDWQRYSAGMTKLLQTIIPGIQLLPPPSPQAAIPTPYFEIDKDSVRFAMLLRMVLLGGKPPAEDSRLLLQSMQDAVVRKRFQTMFDAFIVTRYAPLGKVFERNAFFSDRVRWGGSTFEQFVAELENTMRKAA